MLLSAGGEKHPFHKEAPSTAHGRGTLPSLADAAATELMLLRRS